MGSRPLTCDSWEDEINPPMNTLLQWAKSKSWVAHAIALLGLAAASAITENAQVRNLLIDLFHKHPAIASDLIIAASVVFRYSHSSSKDGVLAAAKKIIDALPTSTASSASSIAQAN